MTMLAGSTLVGVAHSHLPLTYMIVDIHFGKTLPHGSQGSQPMRDQVPKASLSAPLTRAGMNSDRVCVFHLSSSVASGTGQLASRSPGKHVHRLPVLSGGSHWGRPQHGPLQVLRYPAGFDGHTGRDVSKHTFWTHGHNHRAVCRSAYCERSIAAQTASCSLNSTRTRSVGPTETVLRSTGILFLVWTQWLPPSWSGAIRLQTISGQISPRTRRSSS